MLKVKDKNKILKAAREKQLAPYKGASLWLSADFSTDISDQKGLPQNIQRNEKQGPTIKTTLPSKAII